MPIFYNFSDAVGFTSFTQYVGISATVTSITNSLLGPAALTANTSPTLGNDNGFWDLTSPFTYFYNGRPLTRITVCTNSYLGLGGASNLSGVSSTSPSIQKICISATDNSGQRIYSGTEGSAPNRTFRIRFEGTNATTGTLGSPNMVWEATFYEAIPAQIDIQCGTNARSPAGFSGVCSTNTLTADLIGVVNQGNRVTTTGIAQTITTPLYRTYSFDDFYVPADAFRQGGLFGWGNNSSGQVAVNDTISGKYTPSTTFAGGFNWEQVNSNDASVAAIKSDETLWVWGANGYGQLGDNTTRIRSTPVTTFAGGPRWKQVSTGPNHMAAVKTDGTLWVWGSNSSGVCGNSSGGGNILTPITTFAGGTNWKQVACGRFNTAAVKTDGTLWIWGSNNNTQLGHNAANNAFTPITTFAGGTNWNLVALGEAHTVAIKTDGTLWCWGRTVEGQCGNNSSIANLPVTTFAGGTDWKQVSCGYRHTTAIKTDGTLWTWGRSYNGQLGNNAINTSVNRCTPVTTFAGGTNWKQVSGGYKHTAAIKTDGTLWVWGLNTWGQVGNTVPTTPFSSPATPVTTIVGGTNWKQVTAAGLTTLAITYIDNYQ
jgi:hypothetical protein